MERQRAGQTDRQRPTPFNYLMTPCSRASLYRFSLSGTRIPNWDHCPGESINATLNDPKYRTANRNATAGSPEDIWKFQPWRAPGQSKSPVATENLLKDTAQLGCLLRTLSSDGRSSDDVIAFEGQAPVEDPCGMAGGIRKQNSGGTGNGGNGGTYNTTKFAKQGDLGSKVLKPRPTGTVWTRGAAELTAWYITFNHGGGYRFRLCPADGRELTEACFAATPLDFVGSTHTIRYHDNTTKVIRNNVVKEGGGVGWMMV